MIAIPSSARHVGRKLVEGLAAPASDGLIVSHRSAGVRRPHRVTPRRRRPTASSCHTAAPASDGLIVSHRGAGAVQAAVLDRLSMDVANDMLQRGVVVRPINDATCS